MVNKVIYQGRLTKDPELEQTQSGIDKMLFTVAWSERYKEVEKKCFMLCRAWRHNAKFINTYFSKGSQIILEGHLEQEEWSPDNKPVVLVVDAAHFCGSKSEARQDHEQPRKSTQYPEPSDDFMKIPDGVDDDELPFK